MINNFFLIFICANLGGVSLVEIPNFPSPLSLHYPEDYCETYINTETFDFIVVGSGAGGATVARRLAENPCWKVLLLEAGTDPPPQWDIPGIMSLPAPATETAATWNIINIPSSNACSGMVHGHCNFRQAKTLGGCTQLNFMMYVRGNKKDYQEWVDLGNEGWSYEECLPYFLKSENFIPFPITKNGGNMTVSSKYHATGGPISVNLFNTDPATSTIRNSLIAATVEEMGLPFNFDTNGENQIGITNVHLNVGADHYRFSTARAFLYHAPDNLKLCKFSNVDRVLISGKKATGVEWSYKGLLRLRAKAKKEVIISAGGFHSPGVLERSGVGDPKVLRNANVPVVHQLPGVGNNLQDHFLVLGDAWTVDLIQTGPMNLKTTSLASLAAFNDFENGTDVPDLQLLFFGLPSVEDWMVPPFIALLNYGPTLKKMYSEHSRTRDILMIGPALLRPETRGSIHIVSEDKLIPADMKLEIFKDERELQRMIRAMKFTRKLVAGKHMEKHSPSKIRIRECRKLTGSETSDAYFKCVIHTVASSMYHPVGTCKMGPKSDKMAVVDNKLQVHGIENLRVIDASVMPLITRGNTNAPTIMIGERGADFIKDKWKNEGCPSVKTVNIQNPFPESHLVTTAIKKFFRILLFPIYGPFYLILGSSILAKIITFLNLITTTSIIFSLPLPISLFI